MKTLRELFNIKRTENNDLAFKSSLNPLIDILFSSQYYRNHPDQVRIGTTEREKLFAMFIRDPRFGIGERDLGRELMEQSGVTPEDVMLVGRADDLIHMYQKQEYLDYYIELLNSGNYFAKKWAPRLTSGDLASQVAKVIINQMNITQKQYRKLIKLDSTVEYKIAHKDYDIDFQQVPSLALLKYRNKFNTDPLIRDAYSKFFEDLKAGIVKINTTTTNVYDIFKTYVKWEYKEIDDQWTKELTVAGEAEIVFNKLPQVNLGSILPIVDNSASMYDLNDSQGKAKAVGHYVAVNSTFMPNRIITFSKEPRLINLGTNYRNAMEALHSYDDVSNTNFAKVMEMLSKLEGNYPDYLLVLSDMEFDYGSANRKDEVMSIFKQHGAQTKIIWWNFNSRSKTFPETDQYGNIFMSGYSPQLLSLLESGFDGEQFLNKLLDNYQQAIQSIKHNNN